MVLIRPSMVFFFAASPLLHFRLRSRLYRKASSISFAETSCERKAKLLVSECDVRFFFPCSLPRGAFFSRRGGEPHSESIDVNGRPKSELFGWGLREIMTEECCDIR